MKLPVRVINVLKLSVQSEFDENVLNQFSILLRNVAYVFSFVLDSFNDIFLLESYSRKVKEIMKTIRIEIRKAEAYSLLRDLEALNVIRVIQENESEDKSIAKRYAGKLSRKTADELSKQTKVSREEWSTRTI